MNASSGRTPARISPIVATTHSQDHRSGQPQPDDINGHGRSRSRIPPAVRRMPRFRGPGLGGR
jgi:hypothetical protein